MTENFNEIAVRAEGSNVDREMASFTGTRPTFMTTLDTTTDEGKLALYAAISDAAPLSDHLNVPIKLVGFTAQIVEFADEDGVMTEGIRMILIDDKGKSFASMSSGINKALKNIVGVFGDPSTWKAPKSVRAVMEGKKPREFYTLKLSA